MEIKSNDKFTNKILEIILARKKQQVKIINDQLVYGIKLYNQMAMWGVDNESKYSISMSFDADSKTISNTSNASNTSNSKDSNSGKDIDDSNGQYRQYRQYQPKHILPDGRLKCIRIPIELNEIQQEIVKQIETKKSILVCGQGFNKKFIINYAIDKITFGHNNNNILVYTCPLVHIAPMKIETGLGGSSSIKPIGTLIKCEKLEESGFKGIDEGSRAVVPLNLINSDAAASEGIVPLVEWLNSIQFIYNQPENKNKRIILLFHELSLIESEPPIVFLSLRSKLPHVQIIVTTNLQSQTISCDIKFAFDVIFSTFHGLGIYEGNLN